MTQAVPAEVIEAGLTLDALKESVRLVSRHHPAAGVWDTSSEVCGVSRSAADVFESGTSRDRPDFGVSTLVRDAASRT